MDNYEDIINLPHHISETRRRMTNLERAAQFAPFAALTGYDLLVDEAARYTDKMAILSDDAKEEIDRKLRFIKENIKNKPEVSVTYFVPDEYKQGGAYRTLTGAVQKLNEQKGTLTAADTEIPYCLISEILINE